MAAKRERMPAKRNQWAAERVTRTEQSTLGLRSNICTMVDPVRFCGGATQLDRFLDALHSNFNSHGHLFPHAGPYHVKYAISVQDACSHHHTWILEKAAMTDPSESADILSA